MRKKREKFPWMPGMPIEYRVLHCLELGFGTAKLIRAYLHGIEHVEAKQVTQALQRLKRSGVAANDSHVWKLIR